LLEELGGSGDVLSHAFAGSVQRAEIGASRYVASIACLLKERSCAHDILRHASALPVQNAEPRAALLGAAVASLAEKTQRTNGIALDAPATLVHDPEARTSFADAAFTCSLEQRGSAFVIPKDVLSLLKLDGEPVAGADRSRLAGAAQLFGLGVSRVTSGECDGGR
jgi:hypothetical protein